MHYLPVILWLGLLVLSILTEAGTRNLVAVWFMPGEILGIVLGYFGVPLWIQILQFLILTTVLLILTRPLVKRLLPQKPVSTNADRVIGEEALVTQRICFSEGSGQVRVLGQVWSAKAENPDTVIENDSLVRVVRIEGVRVVVCPL